MEQTFETPTPPRLDLRIPAGRIDVEAADTTQTGIRLDGPDELLEQATVEQRGDTILVDADHRRGWLSWRGRELRLRVVCPEGASLIARSKSADVTVRGRVAQADVATASGDVELDVVDGDATAKTASGDVSIGRAGRDLVVDSASGDVDAGTVAGRVRANTVSGDVAVDECGADAFVSIVSGDVALRSVRAGSVQVNSVSGDVQVGVRRGSRVHVDVSSLSGDTTSELELDGAPAGGDGPVVELRVKTVSGDVSIVRAAATEPQEVQQ